MSTTLLTTKQTACKEEKIVRVRSHQFKGTDSWRLIEIYRTGSRFIIEIKCREKGRNKKVCSESAFAYSLAELIERAAYLHFWFDRSDRESINVVDKILEWDKTGTPCTTWG